MGDGLRGGPLHNIVRNALKGEIHGVPDLIPETLLAWRILPRSRSSLSSWLGRRLSLRCSSDASRYTEPRLRGICLGNAGQVGTGGRGPARRGQWPAQWRTFLRRRQSIHALDVEELEGHLRDQVTALVEGMSL